MNVESTILFVAVSILFRDFDGVWSLNGNDNSFLWRINSDPPSYFFGTIHVPYTRVWNYIPLNTKEAFRKSDIVYFELDLTSPQTLSSLSACQLLPPGVHLSQVIPSELFLRLKLHLEYIRGQMPSWVTSDQIERGIDADYLFTAITGNWERKQPIWVTFMINSLTRSDIASRGFPVLDLYLSNLANKANKKIGAIEKVEEQCRPLNLLNSTQVIFALNQTLIRQEELKLGGYSSYHKHYTTDDLINSYKNGNLDEVIFNQDTILLPNLPSSDVNDNRLSREQKRMASNIDEFFQENMIHLRNKRMAARVIDLLVNKPGKSYFFAFGAGHFMGNRSVLDYVQSAGYTVDHISPYQSLDNYKYSSSNPRQYGNQVDGGANSFGQNSPGKSFVAGTFDDLSENEKTRALLQFLHHHQYMEQEEETKRFQELLKQRGIPAYNDDNVNDKDDAKEVEKTVQKSLRIWYGLENSNRISNSSTSQLYLPNYFFFIIIMILTYCLNNFLHNCHHLL